MARPCVHLCTSGRTWGWLRAPWASSVVQPPESATRPFLRRRSASANCLLVGCHKWGARFSRGGGPSALSRGQSFWAAARHAAGPIGNKAPSFAKLSLGRRFVKEVHCVMGEAVFRTLDCWPGQGSLHESVPLSLRGKLQMVLQPSMSIFSGFSPLGATGGQVWATQRRAH